MPSTESTAGLIMLHRSAQERYAKLRRVFVRLLNHFNTDDLDDFIQTANSLREWIKLDPSLSAEQREHLERFTVPESLDWQICHQIANAQKHVKMTRYVKRSIKGGQIPAITVLSVKKGAAKGFIEPPSLRLFATGDEILLEVDGQQQDALGFAVRTFRHFHYIFELAHLPVDQRLQNIPTFNQLVNTI